MSQKASKRRIQTRDMINRALDRRRAGQSYSAIGRSMQISKTRAYQLVIQGLEELQKESKEKAEA